MLAKMLMSKKYSLCLAASLILAAAPTSWATSTCPSTGTIVNVHTSGTTTIQIGVAANFKTALTNWLNNYFFNSTYNSNYAADSVYKVELCSDSTGDLEAAITTNKTYAPALLFAADNTAGAAYGAKASMSYAKGYATLMGYTSASGKTYTISGVSDLINELSGDSQTLSASAAALANYTMSDTLTANTTNSGVLVSDPTLAPYGVAGVNIMNDLKPLVNGTPITYTASHSSDVIPDWLKPLVTYNTVGAANSHIGVDTPAGWTAYSLICTSPTNMIYVKFSDTSLQTDQTVARFVNSGGGQHIYNLINYEKTTAYPLWLHVIKGNGVDTNYSEDCYADQ